MKRINIGRLLILAAFLSSVYLAYMLFSQVPEGVTYAWVLFIPVGLYLPGATLMVFIMSFVPEYLNTNKGVENEN